MAFISASSFTTRRNERLIFSSTAVSSPVPYHQKNGIVLPSTRAATIQMRTPSSPIGGGGRKQSRNRRYRSNKIGDSSIEKKKLEPETVFMEEPPSRMELVVPTISILTVIGIFPFIGAVSRALWVRYKITSRRISVTSGFQGKDQTEIIYRDIDMVKYVRRLGDSADVVVTLKDGAKIEIRSLPRFDEAFKFIMENVSEEVREVSGAA